MTESAKPQDAPQVKGEECTVFYKIGDVAISMKAVLAEPESGYLCLPVIGTKVIILHVFYRCFRIWRVPEASLISR